MTGARFARVRDTENLQLEKCPVPGERERAKRNAAKQRRSTVSTSCCPNGRGRTLAGLGLVGAASLRSRPSRRRPGRRSILDVAGRGRQGRHSATSRARDRKSVVHHATDKRSNCFISLASILNKTLNFLWMVTLPSNTRRLTRNETRDGHLWRGLPRKGRRQEKRTPDRCRMIDLSERTARDNNRLCARASGALRDRAPASARCSYQSECAPLSFIY